ncbi:MAG: hypothetical protein WBP59_09160 [Ilumatobacteraceae bacterium]
MTVTTKRPLARWWTSTISSLRLGWRADAIVIILALVIVAAVSTGIVAAERAVSRAEASSLARTLADAPPESSSLRITVADVFTPSPGDPLVVPRRKLESAAETIEPAVMALYDNPRIVVDSPTFTAQAIDDLAPSSPTTLVLRVQEQLDDHATLAQGGTPLVVPDEISADGEEIAVVEVVIASDTADDLQWTVGTSVLVGPTTDDALFRGYDNLPAPFIVRVAGIVDLDDIDDRFWAGDPRLHRAIVEDTGVGANFTVFAAVTEEQLPFVLSMLGGRAALRVEQRWDLVPGRVTMANVDEVTTALQASDAATVRTAPFGRPAVSIGLLPVLDEEASVRGASRDAVRIASIGIAAAAIGAFVLLQQMAADRRRPWWAQARSRGAGAVAMVSAATTTTAAVVALGSVIGVAVGLLLVGEAPGGVPLGTVAAFAVAMLVVDATQQTIEVRRSLRQTPGRPSRWARAAALLVIVIALASVVTLRRGGAVAGGDGIDVVVLLPIVFVPLAVALTVIAGAHAFLRGRTIGGLSLGVGRLVGVRRAVELRGGPSMVVAVSLAATVSSMSTVLAWSFDASGEPLVDAARGAFVAAAIGSWVLALAGVGVTTLVTMRRRRADQRLLSALGAGAGEFARSVRAELLPLVAVALATGALASTIVLAALDRRLDVTLLTGSDVPSTVTRLGGTLIVMASLFASTLGIVRLAVARRRAGQR